MRVRWGYRRLNILLVREGIVMNMKCVYRLYREEGLAVRRRKRKRVAVARQPMPAPRQLNECWAMDFMNDALTNGRRFRIQPNRAWSQAPFHRGLCLSRCRPIMACMP